MTWRGHGARVQLRASAGQAKLLFKAKGANLHPGQLPITPPVCAELSRTDTSGHLAEATYSGRISRNDGSRFKARTD